MSGGRVSHSRAVSETVRGVIVFVGVLLTVGIWAPLRNQPERLVSGGVASETYFGVFTYLTLRTEFKEPNYTMEWSWKPNRVAATAVVTVVLWGGILATVRKDKGKNRGADL